MNPCFQDLYTVPGTDTPLMFYGDMDCGRWTNGALISPDQTEYAKVVDGAALFIEPAKVEDLWGTDSEIGQYLGRKREGLVHQNYRDRRTEGTQLYKYGEWVRPFADQIGGLILEAAVGPQGGLFPFLLSLDPTKTILANDIGRWIVQDWNRVNQLEGIGKSLSFAQFDIQKCAIRSGSIDCIISNQGVSNTEDVRKVLKEMHRILKGGGRMVLEETSFSENTLNRLTPEGKAEARAAWLHADATVYLKAFTDSGLRIVQCDLVGHGQAWPVRGTWGDFGQKHGIVPLETDIYHVLVEKPR